MALRCPVNHTSIWIVAIVLACAGCADAVRLIQETTTGGVVTYLYKEDRGGPMGSPHRKEALKIIDAKCPTGYTVAREGEAKGYSSMSTVEGREGEVTGRRWGIQFQCK